MKKRKGILAATLAMMMGFGILGGVGNTVEAETGSVVTRKENENQEQDKVMHVTGEAVEPVKVTLVDKTETIEFEVVRDKNAYRFGETIYLTLKATNIGEEAISISCANVGEAGCLSVDLKTTLGKRLFGGCYMKKQDNQYVPYGGFFAVAILGNMESGKTIGGMQYVETSVEDGQEEGYYNIVVSLSCWEDDLEDYSVSVPVYMYEGDENGDASKEPAPNPANGDVDGNGKVDLNDAHLALKVALRIESISQEAILRANVAGNSSITLEDAELILRIALRMGTNLS